MTKRRTMRVRCLLSISLLVNIACANEQYPKTATIENKITVTGNSRVSEQEGTNEMAELSEAIYKNDAAAQEIAARMGPSAVPILSELLQSDELGVRVRAVQALGAIDIAQTYELMFKALDDEDINVLQAAIAEIEKQEAKVSTPILLGVLDKVTEPNAKNRVILLLGKRLKLNETAPLEKYCNNEQAKSVALHCMTALAKIGVEQRRQQFAAYLVSLSANHTELLEMFDLAAYVDQKWIVPSLRLLLNNKENIQYLGDAAQAMGFPSYLRVCDKAVQLIAKLLGLDFGFETVLAVNYSDEQLAEVNLVASNYQY